MVDDREYWKTQEIAKAVEDRGELRERLLIHSEEHKANDGEVMRGIEPLQRTEGRVLELNVTTAKAKKEMWSILLILTANRSMPTARIITDNGENIVCRMHDADGFVRLYPDVSNLRLLTHGSGMKKALSSRLRSEVFGPEVSQGITSDEAKAVLRNIKLTKAKGSDKIHPRFIHHFVSVSISMLTSIINKSWAETKVPQE